jgi:hypothetical protein
MNKMELSEIRYRRRKRDKKEDQREQIICV